MKKLLFLIGAVALLATAVSAQAPVPFSIYAGGLVSIPNSPSEFKDAYKDGYHGLLGLGLKTMPMTQLVAKIEYHKFAYDQPSGSTMSGGAQNIWLFGADLRIAMGAPALPFKPYILAGGGLAKITYGEFTGTDQLATAVANSSLASDQNKFYYNLGAGLEFKCAPMIDLFAQARYVSISTDNTKTSFIPITVGFKIF